MENAIDDELRRLSMAEESYEVLGNTTDERIHLSDEEGGKDTLYKNVAAPSDDGSLKQKIANKVLWEAIVDKFIVDGMLRLINLASEKWQRFVFIHPSNFLEDILWQEQSCRGMKTPGVLSIVNKMSLEKESN